MNCTLLNESADWYTIIIIGYYSLNQVTISCKEFQGNMMEQLYINYGKI